MTIDVPISRKSSSRFLRTTFLSLSQEPPNLNSILNCWSYIKKLRNSGTSSVQQLTDSIKIWSTDMDYKYLRRKADSMHKHLKVPVDNGVGPSSNKSRDRIAQHCLYLFMYALLLKKISGQEMWQYFCATVQVSCYIQPLSSMHHYNQPMSSYSVQALVLG